MIIHARLTTQVDSGEFADADIPLPTSVIDSTDAPHLLYTLQTRLPLMFRFDPGVRYALILNCDSAPSNSRLARHMIALAEKEPFVFLHSRCMMHMACATIVTLLKELDLTNSAFLRDLTTPRRGADESIAGGSEAARQGQPGDLVREA